jgi:predicted DNA-binding transcriptional regulator AlpA
VVAAAEVARILGVSRQRVSQVTAKSDFPAPIAALTVGKVWAYADVRAWAERTGRVVHPVGGSVGGRGAGRR